MGETIFTPIQIDELLDDLILYSGSVETMDAFNSIVEKVQEWARRRLSRAESRQETNLVRRKLIRLSLLTLKQIAWNRAEMRKEFSKDQHEPLVN